uniref:MACPF domain-containing protein n=1 Tax=Knipowitschia caucasica TaxID=637954 RepID=A0AAV2LH19_KNICA
MWLQLIFEMHVLLRTSHQPSAETCSRQPQSTPESSTESRPRTKIATSRDLSVMAHASLTLLLLTALFSLALCTAEECDKVPFVPGHNLMGEGFDIVTLKRKGAYVVDVQTYMTPNGTCNTFQNPLQGNQLQKLPLSALDFRAFTNCRTDVYHSTQYSVSEVVSTVTSQDSSDWKLELSHEDVGGLEVGGTRSDLYNFASARMKEDKFTFSIHRSSCTHYRYRVSSTPPLSSEFRKDVLLLPSSYNSSSRVQYRRLINTYGTHYIRQANLGGQYRRLTAVRTCLSALNGFSTSQAHGCLSAGISLGLGKSRVGASFTRCSTLLQNNDAATSSSSGMQLHRSEVEGGQGWNGQFSLLSNDSRGYNTWLQTLKDHPDVVQYSLRLMSDLVPHPQKSMQVRAAIVDYLKENGISKNDKKPCGQNCCPKRAWSGVLTVTIVRAWGLKGDPTGRTEGYAKMWYGPHFRQTGWIRSNSPYWNAHTGQADSRLWWVFVWCAEHL